MKTIDVNLNGKEIVELISCLQYKRELCQSAIERMTGQSATEEFIKEGHVERIGIIDSIILKVRERKTKTEDMKVSKITLTYDNGFMVDINPSPDTEYFSTEYFMARGIVGESVITGPIPGPPVFMIVSGPTNVTKDVKEFTKKLFDERCQDLFDIKCQQLETATISATQ